jgi:hypothetical protein
MLAPVARQVTDFVAHADTSASTSAVVGVALPFIATVVELKSPEPLNVNV